MVGLFSMNICKKYSDVLTYARNVGSNPITPMASRAIKNIKIHLSLIARSPIWLASEYVIINAFINL